MISCSYIFAMHKLPPDKRMKLNKTLGLIVAIIGFLGVTINVVRTVIDLWGEYGGKITYKPRPSPTYRPTISPPVIPIPTPKSIASTVDISGKWQITQNIIKDGSVETWTIAFQQVGNRAFGTIVSQKRNTDLVATLQGNTLSFAVRTPIGTVEMAGIVNGDNIRGTSCGPPPLECTWSARRYSRY
jgi:hypothetical protein